MGQTVLLPNKFAGTHPETSAIASDSFDLSSRQALTQQRVVGSCSSYELIPDVPSDWSCSRSKRLFDIACILAFLPIVLPLCLIVGLSVWMTSPGPVLFLQDRMGREGKTFKILKFRTMRHSADATHSPVTTNSCQQITVIGLLLRKWKLDELPQLLNVLLGQMSLVGARPKVEDHQCGVLHTRPGITGAATLAFAREGANFDRIPSDRLQSYYRDVILPVKWRLDVEYMSTANFFSDLNLILRSVFRQWNHSLSPKLLCGENWDSVRHERTGMHCSARRSRHVVPRWYCIACRSVPSELMNHLFE